MNKHDEILFNYARYISNNSNCKKRHYGAVLVSKDSVIIGAGWNNSPVGVEGCKECRRLNVPHNTNYKDCISVHAEQSCIIQAKQSDMEGGTLYLYGTNADGSEIKDISPCYQCKKLIIEAGIKTVRCMSGETLIDYDVKDLIEELNAKQEYRYLLIEYYLVDNELKYAVRDSKPTIEEICKTKNNISEELRKNNVEPYEILSTTNIGSIRGVLKEDGKAIYRIITNEELKNIAEEVKIENEKYKLK